ncbi:unnamed protein product, partial [Rotaria sordida]
DYYYEPTTPPTDIDISFTNIGEYVTSIVPAYTEQQFKELLRRQIEYYFSSENLQVDIFLRQQMTKDSYVPLSLIAYTVQDSLVVELNDKCMVHCRNEPDRWPLMIDVNNHLTALNPDVPDFQLGKIWKNENQKKKEQSQVKSSKQDNRKELPNKQINLSLFRSQNWCRTTSLTLDLYEEHKIDESDFELDDDDDDIDKILIITPTLPSNRKHNQQNHDRTGDYTPRAKVSAEVAKIIDDGL